MQGFPFSRRRKFWDYSAGSLCGGPPRHRLWKGWRTGQHNLRQNRFIFWTAEYRLPNRCIWWFWDCRRHSWNTDRLKAHAQSFSEVLSRERMGLTFEKRSKIQSNTLVRPTEQFISTYIFTKYFKTLHQATLNKCIIKNRIGHSEFFHNGTGLLLWAIP